MARAEDYNRALDDAMSWWGWIALLMAVCSVQIEDTQQLSIRFGTWRLHFYRQTVLLLIWMLWWSAWQ